MDLLARLVSRYDLNPFGLNRDECKDRPRLGLPQRRDHAGGAARVGLSSESVPSGRIEGVCPTGMAATPATRRCRRWCVIPARAIMWCWSRSTPWSGPARRGPPPNREAPERDFLQRHHQGTPHDRPAQTIGGDGGRGRPLGQPARSRRLQPGHDRFGSFLEFERSSISSSSSRRDLRPRSSSSPRAAAISASAPPQTSTC